MGAAGADTARAAHGAPQHEQSLTCSVCLLRSTKLPASLIAPSSLALEWQPNASHPGWERWAGQEWERSRGKVEMPRIKRWLGMAQQKRGMVRADRENPNLALSTLPLTEQPSPFPTRKAGGVHKVRSSPCSDPSGVLTSKKQQEKERCA